MPGNGTVGASYGDLLLTSLVVLGAVCIAAFAVVRLAGRLLATGRTRGAQLLSVVARLPLEPKRSLYVVEVAGRTLLVGTSEMGLSLLSELDGDQVRAQADDRPSFGELVRKAWLGRRGLGTRASPGASEARTAETAPRDLHDDATQRFSLAPPMREPVVSGTQDGGGQAAGARGRSAAEARDGGGREHGDVRGESMASEVGRQVVSGTQDGGGQTAGERGRSAAEARDGGGRDHGDESTASEAGRQVVRGARAGEGQGAVISGERDAAPRGGPSTEPGDAGREIEAAGRRRHRDGGTRS
jgi:flagellar biogenesis protein FliO